MNDTVIQLVSLFSRPNGIAGRNGKGEGLILFIGIIDVLKHYSLEQRAAHSLKATVHDGVSHLSLDINARE